VSPREKMKDIIELSARTNVVERLSSLNLGTKSLYTSDWLFAPFTLYVDN
jgi:hypothetical protein